MDQKSKIGLEDSSDNKFNNKKTKIHEKSKTEK